MGLAQVPSRRTGFTLRPERLGPLPVVNHFLHRLGLEELLEKYVPTRDRRVGGSHAQSLGVVLRAVIVGVERR